MGGAVRCRRAAPSTGVNARLDGRRRRCAARRTACAPRASSATSRSSRCRGPTSCPRRPMASRSARSVQPSSELADPRHSPICLDSMPRGRLGSPQHRPRGRAATARLRMTPIAERHGRSFRTFPRLVGVLPSSRDRPACARSHAHAAAASPLCGAAFGNVAPRTARAHLVVIAKREWRSSGVPHRLWVTREVDRKSIVALAY